MLRWLLDEDADIMMCAAGAAPAAIAAARGGHTDVLQFLQSRGYDGLVEGCDAKGATALHEAAFKSKVTELFTPDRITELVRVISTVPSLSKSTVAPLALPETTAKPL